MKRVLWKPVGLLVALLAVWWLFDSWQGRGEKIVKLNAQRAALAAQLADYHNGISDESKRVNAIGQNLDSERATLRVARSRDPVPVVRLCQPAPTGAAVPPDPATAAGGDGSASAATEGIPSVSERDIGRELAGLLDQSDELSAQLRAAQAYIGSLPKQCLVLP